MEKNDLTRFEHVHRSLFVQTWADYLDVALMEHGNMPRNPVCLLNVNI